MFELHLPLARSLKDKRSVVRSIRDRLRRRPELSVAEVALGDLHQRARLAACMVSGDRALIEKSFAAAQEMVEADSESELLGWDEDYSHYDDDAPLELPSVDGFFGD